MTLRSDYFLFPTPPPPQFGNHCHRLYLADSNNLQKTCQTKPSHRETKWSVNNMVKKHLVTSHRCMQWQKLTAYILPSFATVCKQKASSWMCSQPEKHTISSFPHNSPLSEKYFWNQLSCSNEHFIHLFLVSDHWLQSSFNSSWSANIIEHWMEDKIVIIS
jgi:hypothetical protein